MGIKKITLLGTMLVFIGLMIVSFTSIPANAALSNDFLKTNGKDIRNNAGTGSVAVLCGVNLGGWMLFEPWMSPLAGENCEYTMRNRLDSRFGSATKWSLLNTFYDGFIQESDFQRIRNEGLNMVRLVVYWENHMDRNGNWLSGAFTRLDWAISMASKYGLYTIIDLHGVPGSQNGQDHSGWTGSGAQLYNNTTYQNYAVKFWQGIANRYKGVAAVAGYDLMNEPSAGFPGASGSEVTAMMRKLYSAVRAIDPDHIIFFNFIWHWTVFPNPANEGWTNVVYEVHNYGDPIANSVQWANECRNAYNIPYYIGEFQYDGQSTWTYNLTQFMNNNISWSSWTYKVKGTGSPWGMYTCNSGDTNTANVVNDSEDTIRSKWSRHTTANYYTRNASVCEGMKAAINTKTSVVLRPNYWVIGSTPTPGPTATPTPVAGYAIPGKIEAENYSAMNGIQTEATGDTGGGLNIGWTDTGDWMDYNVNVATTGTYEIQYRVASPNNNSQIQLRRGTTTLATTTVPNTGGWQNWQTISANTSLSAGAQTLRLYVSAGGFNINWLNFAVIGPTPTPTPAPGGGIVSGATYYITARHSGKALDVANVSTADGANVHQWSYVGGNNQKWVVTSLGSGYYSIINVNSGKSLDVTGGPGATGDGVNIQQWSYVGGTNQQWQIIDVGGGYYRIMARHSGKCVDVDGGSGATGDGVNVHQWSYAGGTNQQWRFNRL